MYKAVMDREPRTKITPEIISIPTSTVTKRGSERFSWVRSLGALTLATTGLVLGITGAYVLTGALAGVLPENPLAMLTSTLPPDNYPVKLGPITAPFSVVHAETTIIFALGGMMGGFELADRLLRKRD